MRRLARSAALLAALALALSGWSAVASAAGPRSGPSSGARSSPVRIAVKPPAPAKASARLALPDAFFVGAAAVTVPARTIHVTGVVRPYVAGQWVSVRAYLGRRLVKRDQLRIRPTRQGTVGSFTERLKSPRPGTLIVQVTHRRTPQMLGFLARRRLAALAERAGWGSRGPFVALMQQQLAARHIYIRPTGVYDAGMGLALDAYHRLLGRGVSQSLDGATIGDLLNGVGDFTVRYPRDGKHVEGNLGRQLLALIVGAHVYRIYPISSGKPSTPTILGHFRVYQRHPGYLPDGMYYSSFFSGGYAIHGYDPAPDYPASHGCLRLPIADALSVYNWVNFGDVVDVYHP